MVSFPCGAGRDFLTAEGGGFKRDGLNGLVQAARGIGGLVPPAEGAVGVPAVLGDVGDEGLLPRGQLRWLGSEGGGQFVALDGEGVDGASEVAGDEEFELGVGEEAVLRARVLAESWFSAEPSLLNRMPKSPPSGEPSRSVIFTAECQLSSSGKPEVGMRSELRRQRYWKFSDWLV